MPDALHPLQVGRTLFVFAHPDDDTLIGGTMRELIERGAEVHGIWVTSGEHQAAQTALRWGETLEAMAALGMDRDRIRFLDLPFLQLQTMFDEVADELACLLRDLRPAQVVSVGFEGGHIDHDAVNFLTCEALRRSRLDVPLYEFPLYNGDGPVTSYRFKLNAFPRSLSEHPTFYVRLSPGALARKYASMRAYRSQWGYMATFHVMAFFRGFARQGEPLRRVSLDRDYTVPPHPGKLNIERWFNRYMNVTFADFVKAVRACRAAVEARRVPVG